MEQLTFLSEAHPVSPSVLQGREKVLKTIEETWHSPSAESQTSSNQTGLSGRTSQVSLKQGQRLRMLSGRAFRAVSPRSRRKMGPRGLVSGRNAKLHGVLDLSSSGTQKKKYSSSLLQILETSDPQKRYSLTEGCVGILRRAVNRGKTLPPLLEDALLKHWREDHIQPEPVFMHW